MANGTINITKMQMHQISFLFVMFEWFRRRSISHKLSSVRLIVLDVDGVLTDGGLWYGETGEVVKRFDVRDGLGIKLLQEIGIEVAFLSGGKAGAIEIRAKHLGIRHCLFEVKDKVHGLTYLLAKVNLERNQVAFIGDDLNDLAVLSHVGLLIAPSDAVEPLKRRANLVLRSPGGKGAVREFAELVLKNRNKWINYENNGWRARND